MSTHIQFSASKTLLSAACLGIAQYLYAFNEALMMGFRIKILTLCIIVTFVQLLCCIVWWKLRKPSSVVCWYGDCKRDQMNVWLTGLVQSTVFLSWYACMRLPLGDMQSILYQSPLWLLCISWLILPSANMPKSYILIPSMLLTILGVLLVLQPPFWPLHIDGIVAIQLSALRVVACVLLVKMAQNVHFLQYELTAGLCMLCIVVPVMVVLNTFVLHNDMIGTLQDLASLSLLHVLLCVYMGVASFAAIAFVTMGVQSGDAAIVSGIEYMRIPISFLFQTYVFNEYPNLYEGVGGAMVFCGCVLPEMHRLYAFFFDPKHLKQDQSVEYEEIASLKDTKHNFVRIGAV